jgi:hypothetical protein
MGARQGELPKYWTATQITRDRCTGGTMLVAREQVHSTLTSFPIQKASIGIQCHSLKFKQLCKKKIDDMHANLFYSSKQANIIYTCISHIVLVFQWCILGWLQLFFSKVSSCNTPLGPPCASRSYKNRHLSVYSKETIINNLTVTGLTIILICEIKKNNHAVRKRGSAILQL